jgi:hypothetical protein
MAVAIESGINPLHPLIYVAFADGMPWVLQ